MNLELWVQVGTLVSTATGAIGLLAATVIYRRQMNAQLFLQYTQRYEEVMQAFPTSARGARLALSGDPPESSQELTFAILRYLNLCSEEFYLWERGYLSGRIWRIWKAELERTLRSPLIRREWKELCREFETYPEFKSYVEKAQAA